MKQEPDNSDSCRVAEAINRRSSELDDMVMTMAIEAAGVVDSIDPKFRTARFGNNQAQRYGITKRATQEAW